MLFFVCERKEQTGGSTEGMSSYLSFLSKYYFITQNRRNETSGTHKTYRGNKNFLQKTSENMKENKQLDILD